MNIIHHIEQALSVEAIDALPLADLKRLEATLYHWQSVVASRLRERIALTKEEEAE